METKEATKKQVTVSKKAAKPKRSMNDQLERYRAQIEATEKKIKHLEEKRIKELGALCLEVGLFSYNSDQLRPHLENIAKELSKSRSIKSGTDPH